MTAGTVKKSPVIVVKKKRQFTLSPVAENRPVPAAPDREETPSAASESPVASDSSLRTDNSVSSCATKKGCVRFAVTIYATDGRSCPSSDRSFLSSGLKITSFALLRSVLSKMLKPLLTKTLTAVSHLRTAAAFSPWLLRGYPISVFLPPEPFVTTSTDCPPAPSLKGKSSTHARPVNAFSVFSNKRLKKRTRTPLRETAMRKMTESWCLYASGRAPFRINHSLLRDSQ